ncbi:hypothetical protein [Amycolatopsis magusensis]|uniref:hypothetical protein n=1 Tax=Amycolatopsis magusensis TaxID=882444 RepID=UPI00379E2E72
MSLPLALQAALISAATAAVVTLMIEYAAKPRLEVRKDRIVSIAKARRMLNVQIFMSLNNASFRLLETAEDPAGVEIERVKDRLRSLAEDLAAAERAAEELFALGFRGAAGRALNNSVAGAHYALKRPVEDLPAEPDWSSTRRVLREVDVLLDISLELCRPRWRLRYWRERSRTEKFRDFRVAEVTEKRRDFLNMQYNRLND